jgi:hypothetical protein
MRLALPALASGMLLAASTATAQLPAFAATGSDVADGRDNRWQVACTVLAYDGAATPTMVGASACTGSFFAAHAFTEGLPPGWDPVPAGTSWIAARPNGTFGRVLDGTEGPTYDYQSPLYEYTFRYTFAADPDLAPGSLALDLDLLRLDNYWVGYRVNGGALVPTGITPEPAPASGANWTREFAVGGVGTTGARFVAGTNTFDLVVRGNGEYDGIVARGAFSTVPEPSTYALVASGLAVVGGVARRRRQG